MIAGTGEILEEHTNPLLGLRHGVPPPPGHPYLAITTLDENISKKGVRVGSPGPDSPFGWERG